MITPRITFGMIVLNGEPFIRYNLRALYPFAHQIIVVEGACPSAESVATEDGHSRDGTLESLRRFQAEDDPEGKVTVVTAEDEGHPNGFWTEKDKMSQAYAKRATGDYLWQVDVDEFYKPEDMQEVIRMLSDGPGIKEASFRMLAFWGGLSYRVDGIYLQRGAQDFHRLFAWNHSYCYTTHRPPTVLDEKGRNLRDIKAVGARTMARKGIYLYHYELLFPKQVREKCAYYMSANWTDSFRNLNQWMHSSYLSLMHPFRVHMDYNFVSWLEHFWGEHPPQVVEMVEAVRRGEHAGVDLRGTDDIEDLISRPFYRMRRALLKFLVRRDVEFLKLKAAIRTILVKTRLWPTVEKLRGFK
jgi:hypothetical protein